MSQPSLSPSARSGRPAPPPGKGGPVFPQGWQSAADYNQPAWEEDQGCQDMSAAPYPQGGAEDSLTYSTQAVLMQPPVKLTMIRLLCWLALLAAAAALFFSIFPRSYQAPAALEMTEGALSGAIAERVGKLEKDVSSLLLKMVTLEKNMEEAKNHNLAPAAASDLNNRISALNNQLNELNSKVNILAAPGSVLPSSGTAGAGRASSAQAPSGAGPAPDAAAAPNHAASSRVEERAGNKPPPLATALSAAGAGRPEGRPRESYVVQPGDTLFAIAKNFNVSAKDLRAWNGMGEDDVLKSGKVLVIY
jgi:LysM repeat protein